MRRLVRICDATLNVWKQQQRRAAQAAGEIAAARSRLEQKAKALSGGMMGSMFKQQLSEHEACQRIEEAVKARKCKG